MVCQGHSKSGATFHVVFQSLRVLSRPYRSVHLAIGSRDVRVTWAIIHRCTKYREQFSRPSNRTNSVCVPCGNRPWRAPLTLCMLGVKHHSLFIKVWQPTGLPEVSHQVLCSLLIGVTTLIGIVP